MRIESLSKKEQECLNERGHSFQKGTSDQAKGKDEGTQD